MDSTLSSSGPGRIKRKQSGNKSKTLPCPHCQRLFARLVRSPHHALHRPQPPPIPRRICNQTSQSHFELTSTLNCRNISNDISAPTPKRSLLCATYVQRPLPAVTSSSAMRDSSTREKRTQVHLENHTRDSATTLTAMSRVRSSPTSLRPCPTPWIWLNSPGLFCLQSRLKSRGG